MHITRRRSDGYHELQTLFQLVDYCDELDFSMRSDTELNVACNADIPLQDNLVLKAAHLLRQHCRRSKGVDIYLHKRIAVGMGLGGGSSDAATTLRVLNQLWDCRLDTAQLAAYGRDLGADVPLFIAGRSAWGEGIGDILSAVDLPQRWYAVFMPPYKIDTRTMFGYPELKRNCTSVTMEDYLADATSNVFEAVIKNRYPQIGADMERLSRFCPVRLTGSGGAFFASCETRQQAAELSEHCPHHLQTFIAQGINKSPLTDIAVTSYGNPE